MQNANKNNRTKKTEEKSHLLPKCVKKKLCNTTSISKTTLITKKQKKKQK